MSTYRQAPQDIEDQLALYFDNQATPEVVQAIQDWLEEDPANAGVFAEYGSIERMIYCAQKSEDASAVFALLAEAEEKAGPDFSLLQTPKSFAPETSAGDRPTGPRELFALAGYAAAKGLRSKAGLIGSIAAVLVLGLLLYIAFIGSDPAATPPETAANTPVEPDRHSPAHPIVATLTAERNAVWQSRPGGAPRPGTPLAAGQRLTLVEGFAEVTTNHGAVAVIQAPATIELIDSDNALRLHTGRLVGLCETKSAEGFVVRAPHADVTDLGTRFGIDATDPESTSVAVFEGEVQVTRLIDQADPQAALRLGPGQSIVSTDAALVRTLFDGRAYNAMLGIDAFRPGVEGGPVVWQGMLPYDLRSGQQEAQALQVFLERRAVVLDTDVPVDMTPGEAWPPERGFGKAAVPSGTAVDVYLLHMDRPQEPHQIRTRPIQCVIRFDRPIVGVIASESTLRRTDAGLSLPGVLQPTVVDPDDAANPAGGLAGLEFDTKYEDTAVISNDGMTLELELHAPIAVDQVRVLVQSQHR